VYCGKLDRQMVYAALLTIMRLMLYLITVTNNLNKHLCSIRDLKLFAC